MSYKKSHKIDINTSDEQVYENNTLRYDYYDGCKRYWGEHVNFSVEPSNEKDYDIHLMTGNNDQKGSEKK